MKNKKENKMRSDMIKVGVDKAPARGLLYATGQVKSSKDMQKPFMLFVILILILSQGMSICVSWLILPRKLFAN